MIVCDTSGLYALYVEKQPDHEKVAAAIEDEQLVVSPYVLTELDYLLRTRTGVDGELVLLRDVEAGAYDVEDLTLTEYRQAIQLIERYRDHNIGLADAANVVLAARHRTTRILTLDERDFRIIRPLWGDAFTVLPADS
ncbi:PIN domain-containing protein [Tenggerimyces flavus]|uniref:Ribonuclease VapC n=1 Tax=Tenggerimyces flavus TaxID=1708749 RepID=A0ABV7Y9S6_9ACTN|nr:PIN domain-containing protein [Tenggerimyces flavus]MBM7788917.1 putative nucleic acid-binding protein [Tenggerimyces flavus]